MKFGYARVSTKHQSLEHQVAQLEQVGCDKIFSDTISGYNKPKHQFNLMIEQLRENDLIVVTSLDRLGRNTKELFVLLDDLHKKEVNLLFLSTPELDTRTAMGRLLFGVGAVLAENERMRTVERVRLGMEGARTRGKTGARPLKLDKKKAKRMRELYDAKQLSVKELCLMYDIGKTTFYDYIRRYA